MEAYVKSDVGFEKTTLSVGDILADHQTIKDVYIDVRGFKGVEIDTIITTAPYIKARQVALPDTAKNDQRIRMEVLIGPGLKPGLISETIRVKYKDSARPESKLYIYGIAVKDVDVTPLALTYIVVDTAVGGKPQSRTLTVTNRVPDTSVKILKVSDPGGLLDYKVTEVEPGRTFKVIATLNEAKLAAGATIASNVIIATDYSSMAEIKIPFRIERR